MLKSPTTLQHRVGGPSDGDDSHGGKADLMSAVTTLMPPSLVSVDSSSTVIDNSPDLCDTICNIGPMLQFQDICSAAFRINDGILKSPCEKSILSELVGCDIYFKKDYLQITGSFKERSARHILMMLTEQQRMSGVITASSGNFALGLSFQGQLVGVPITIVMPMASPLMKIQASKNYGAEVIIWGQSLKQAKDYAMKISKEKGSYFIEGYDHPFSIAGAGTMGLEIVEQIPDVDAVIVPVGSGALIAGVALAVKTLKPSVKIIGVESETCPNFSLSLEAGRPVMVHPESSLADGLAVSQVGYNAFNICAHLVDKVVVTREEFIALAVLRMAEKEKAIIEGSGACGLAALLAGELPELSDKKVVVCLTGGNIDTTTIGRCLERGLAVDGRLIKVTVTVGDRPGGICELVQLISKMGISIKDIYQERSWIKSDIFSAKVKVVCETRDRDHALQFEKELRNRYTQVSLVYNFEPDLASADI